jgi:hypothetical protein
MVMDQIHHSKKRGIKMNRSTKGIITGSLILSLSIIQAGCSSSQQPQNQSAPNKSAQTGSGNMNMDHNKMNMGSSSNSSASTNQGLQKAFVDELNGLAKMEQDAQKGNVKNDSALADQLHEEFHAAILSPLKDKKGNTYAEDVHSKYDELQDAVKKQDKNKILQLVKVNRDNLQKAADILGVKIK